MNFLEIINKDKEICELKSFIEKETGHVPGFRFWDGELIEEYRERLRRMAKEIKKENKSSLVSRDFS